MNSYIEKVTLFITRMIHGQENLLLFKHPYAGIQIPAGTVKNSEIVEEAALREAKEETNISEFTSIELIGTDIERYNEGYYSISKKSFVYSRPSETSFDWIEIRRGVHVEELRQHGRFKQIKYVEYDAYPENNQISYKIIGWIPQEALVSSEKRYFFRLTTEVQTENEWDVFTDNHTFRVFWVALEKLPSVIYPQNMWLSYLDN